VAAAGPEAIVIHCTNFRGTGEVAALEAELGIPVLDSIAVALWASLRLGPGGAAILPRLARWGRLFSDAR
jgi:maleate isomerase